MTELPVLSPVPFYYLRHGQTDWNKQDLCQGNVDIPLNETGLEQARIAAGMLVGRGIASIYSSPFQRALVTAEIVGKTIDLPVAIEHDLRETSFGVLEGKPMGPEFHAWVNETLTPAGAESFAELRQRAATAINRVLAAAKPPTLVVAHGALFRALRSAMRLDPNQRLPNATPLLCTPGDTAWTLTPLG